MWRAKMKKTHKRIMITILSVAALLPISMFLIGGCIISGVCSRRFTARRAEQILERDYELLTTAVRYAADGRADAAAELLYGLGYMDVLYSNGRVTFQRWATLRAGRGIVYFTSGDSSDAPAAYFTHLAPLSVRGWYFYASE